MRTSKDALMSMRLYVAEALGDDWEVRFADDAGAFTLPFALIDLVNAATFDGPARWVETTQPFAISCYPDLSATASEAKLTALAIQEKLIAAFRLTGVGYGAPMRVPLYDTDGQALTDPVYRRNDHDYMRVVDFSTALLADPEEHWRFAVTADVRCSWRRTARVSYGSHVVKEVRTSLEVKD